MSLSQLPAEILKWSFKFTASVTQVFCMSRCLRLFGFRLEGVALIY